MLMLNKIKKTQNKNISITEKEHQERDAQIK
jgi:hypothetical protein